MQRFYYSRINIKGITKVRILDCRPLLLQYFVIFHCAADSNVKYFKIFFASIEENLYMFITYVSMSFNLGKYVFLCKELKSEKHHLTKFLFSLKSVNCVLSTICIYFLNRIFIVFFLFFFNSSILAIYFSLNSCIGVSKV